MKKRKRKTPRGRDGRCENHGAHCVPWHAVCFPSVRFLFLSFFVLLFLSFFFFCSALFSLLCFVSLPVFSFPLITFLLSACAALREHEKTPRMRRLFCPAPGALFTPISYHAFLCLQVYTAPHAAIHRHTSPLFDFLTCPLQMNERYDPVSVNLMYQDRLTGAEKYVKQNINRLCARSLPREHREGSDFHRNRI